MYNTYVCVCVLTGCIVIEQTATGYKRVAGLEAACCKVDNCEIDCHYFATEVF